MIWNIELKFEGTPTTTNSIETRVTNPSTTEHRTFTITTNDEKSKWEIYNLRFRSDNTSKKKKIGELRIKTGTEFRMKHIDISTNIDEVTSNLCTEMEIKYNGIQNIK